MNNLLEKLYCYLRVSSDVQMNDGGSLDVQGIREKEYLRN